MTTDSGSGNCSAVWVVVPAYNEASRIPATLRDLRRHARNIVVVDDGSQDETRARALEEGVWVVRHPINCGQGAAIQTGIDFALRQDAEIVVTFDADGQHLASDIDSLIEPIVDGACDVVLGSRFLGNTENLAAGRLLVLKAGVWFTRLASGIRVSDTHNGLRAFSRAAAERIRIRENRMAHASEILHQIQQLNLAYCERAVTVRYNDEVRAKGQSSWSALEIAFRFLVGNTVR
jgi:glycosyltransferase involved in cell wall biosynthesis